MDREQAKAVLALYRPGREGEDGPEMAEALAVAERDPELARWLEERSAVYRAIQAKFKSIEVPDGLKEQILAERVTRTKISWARSPGFLAAAAVLVVSLGLAVFWLRPRPENKFAVYRNRMAGTALRDYRMDLVTNDLNAIRQFLQTNKGYGDYVLTKPLAALPGVGCALLSWRAHPVSMVCLEVGQQNPLYLFVIDRSALADPPPASAPQFARVGKLATASWSQGDKAYLLAGLGDEAFLRKYF